MRVAPRILCLCYGNPSRGDDGLGPAMGQALEEAAFPGVTVEVDYQLGVEHAMAVAEHDVVLFIDAAARGAAPFEVRRVEPRAVLSFSSHSLTPEQVLGLAAEVFGAAVPGFVVAIRGYHFGEFREELSDEARENLEAALAYTRRILHDWVNGPADGWEDPAALPAGAQGVDGYARRETRDSLC
ncbi:MAG: hypothetical protein Kow00109_04020 [Acidobacteriota bacterium]